MDVKSLHWAVVADRRAGIAAQVLQGVAARGEGGQVDAHHGGAPERWRHEGQREVRRPVEELLSDCLIFRFDFFFQNLSVSNDKKS